MSKVLKSILALITAFAMTAAVVGCKTENKKPTQTTTVETTEPKTEDSTQKLEKLTYSLYVAHSAVTPKFVPDDKDVLGKYVEEKFGIRVGQVLENQGLTYKERINLFIASDDLPDVVSIFGDATIIPSTGRYAELGNLIKENCPNYMKLVPEKYWKNMSYNGRVYSMGSNIAQTAEEIGGNPYYRPPITWAALYTSESVLAKCGYSFTPLTEINKQLQAGTPPSADLYKITPEIKTEEDFYNFLKKIKTEIPKVNGKDVIPFSLVVPLQPHFGYMFGLGIPWKFDPTTKSVYSFFDDPYAKNFWKFMNRLYNEGLLDKDFAVQKPEQMNENILNGRIKCFMYSLSWPSNADVQKALREVDPNDNVRAIPMPLKQGAVDVGQFHYGRAPVLLYINKDFKDIPRLLRYFDWWLSEEGLAMQSWGPEELGLWEIKDGKRKWKSEELYNALKNADSKYIEANFEKNGFPIRGDMVSKILWGIPTTTFNPYQWTCSYPLNVNVDDTIIQVHYVSNVREKAQEMEGYIANGADEISQKIDGFLAEFVQQWTPNLFAAKTEADFEKAWDALQKHLKEKLDFEKAKKNMELYFKLKGFK